MATELVTTPSGTFSYSRAPQVYVSTDIQDAESWSLVPYLWCDELKLAVNAYSTATLHYEVGQQLLQPGGTAFGSYQPLSLRGKYVKIIVEQEAELDDIVWVGYILTDILNRDGVKEVGGVQKFEGEKQGLACVGLEWFLDRRQIESSLVESSAAAGFVELQRALKFNGGESSIIDMKAAHRGNRATDTNDDGLYYFTSDPTTQDKWTAADIVRHLLAYQGPRDSDDNHCPCSYEISDDDASYLDGFHPTLPSEHQTVFAMLNKIAAPQRGLCWWLEFNPDENFPTAMIRVASLAREEIGLGTGDGVLPANANQITLNFDSEFDVRNVLIKNQGKRNYHKFTARGARQTVTFTVGFDDETLVPDWKDETETAYGNAAKDGTDDAEYTALTTAKKKERNDAYRKTDLLSSVYSFFRIPEDWDGKSGDGMSGTTKHYAIAEISTTGSVLGGIALAPQGIRLLNQTRLKVGVDYHDPSNIVSNAPDGSLEEFVRPFALLQVETSPALTEDISVPERWQYSDKLSESTFHAGTRISSNITTNYHLLMQNNKPGIKVVASGAPQHAIAKDYFVPAEQEPSGSTPEVSYGTLRATVCAEADIYATGQYAVDPLPSSVPIEELIIDLGDDYRLDFLAKDTIVDLKNGIPILASDPAVLRDDRQTLRDIARIAFEWYREDRQQLTVEFRQQRNLFSLGQLITTIGEGTAQSTINTVISVITYDFGVAGTTRIETMDDTLDSRVLHGGAMI